MTGHKDHNTNHYIKYPDKLCTPKQTSRNTYNRGDLHAQTQPQNIIYSNRQSERKIVPREEDSDSDGMEGNEDGYRNAETLVPITHFMRE
jgi:hypothetical protein